MPRRNHGPRLKWLEKRSCFYIVWTENGRSRERSTGTDDRQSAETQFCEFLQARQRRTGPRELKAVFVTELLGDYAEEVGRRAIASARIGYAIAPLGQFWQGSTVSEVTSDACHKYSDWRGRSAGTVRRELGVLRAAINYAFKEGRIARSVPISLPEAPESKDRWLTRGEAARLLEAALSSAKARFYLPLFILIGLRTGKRKEAILSLQWQQVDLDRHRIDWNPPGRVRTKKRRPRNPIPVRLLPHLRRARLRGSDSGYVIHNNGVPIKDIKRSFAQACARAGLKDVTPHTLRHTCATWLMQHRVDKWEVCGFLGMTMETLERIYGHHHPDFQGGPANAF